VRVPHLVSSKNDWELEAIKVTQEGWMGHAMRLKSEIEELNRQVAVKRQALKEAQKRVRDLETEFKQVEADHRYEPVDG
jgi:predicted  nucleic acid-binding Zn-ribbon protein